MFPFEVDSTTDVPLWVQLRQRLIYLINSGYFKPGDQLRMHVEKIKARRNVYVFRGEAKVDGQVVSEAEFTAMIME